MDITDFLSCENKSANKIALSRHIFEKNNLGVKNNIFGYF